MKLMKTAVACAVVFCLLFGLAAVGGAAGGLGEKVAPDRVLVKFRSGVPAEEKALIHARHGGAVVGEIRELGVQIVQVAPGRAEEKARDYRREKAVEFAEPDYVAEALWVPNDPYFAKQWGLDNWGQTGGTPDADIDAPEAWGTSTGKDVKVAVLDTGIDQSHEDLKAKIVANKNFTNSRTVDDKYGHGTHVAGIIAAVTDNRTGVAGTAPAAALMNVKVLNDQGSGYYSWVASGIVWAADNGAKVINLSLGGSAPSDTLEAAVNYAWSKGAVVVAAAGNSGTADPVYPAYYANCLAVAATDATDTKAAFSNYGSWVDLAAPGVEIFSTVPDHKNRLGLLKYGSLSGTSMAAPFVSGTAALVWSTGYGESNGSVRERLEATADAVAGTGEYWAHGRVNAARAVQ